MAKSSSHFIKPRVSTGLNLFQNKLRLYGYDTVSTKDSVLVIGGATNGTPYQISIVAEYKDGSWGNIGNLARNRHNHKAIRSGSNIMILGGREYTPGIPNTSVL